MKSSSSRKIAEKFLLWVAQLFFGYNNKVKLTNGDKKGMIAQERQQFDVIRLGSHGYYLQILEILYR